MPPPEERVATPREERTNLAEVIELRTKLVPASSSEPDARRGVEGVAKTQDTGDTSDAYETPSLKRVQGGKEVRDTEEPFDADETAPAVPVLTAAIKLLARRALSTGELQQSLLLAGYPELDAEQAVGECEQALYLNDEDLARSVTQKLRGSKGASRSNIRQKLRERALPPAAIEAALSELDDDEEHALIKQTANDRARRMKDLDRQTAERRLLGFLARRGWSGYVASRAAREALDQAGVSRAGSAGGSVRFR